MHSSAVLYSVEQGQLGTEAYSVVELGARDAVVNVVDVGVGVLAVTYVVISEADKNTSELDSIGGWSSVALPASENVLATSLRLEERTVKSEDGQTS